MSARCRLLIAVFVILGTGLAGAAPTRAQALSPGRSAPAHAPQGAPAAGADAPTPAAATGAPLLEELAPELLKAYLGDRPKAWLSDPQGLLGPIDQRERLAFLEYHAGDSAIDLFVQVFKAGQRVPDEARMNGFMAEHFAQGRPAVLLQYVMGAPERAQIHLSPALRERVPTAERKRALESAMIEALEKIEAPAQFESFLVQLSIRIYWMERILTGQAPAGEKTTSLPVAAIAKSDKAALAARLLKPFEPWIDRARRIAVLAGLGLTAVLVIVVWQRLRLRRLGCRFPEADVEPRLGGAHAAGVGAVISFANATTSPASQRDQVPRYLHKR